MTQHIKNIIEDFFQIQKKEYKEIFKIKDKLVSILGVESKEHFWVKKEKREEIEIIATSSSLLYVLKLKKEDIEGELKREFPKLKTIKMKIG